MIPFEAKAGSIVVMEGRLWHTSGANITSRILFFHFEFSETQDKHNFS